jgi:hypothetical protein
MQIRKLCDVSGTLSRTRIFKSEGTVSR